MYQSCIFPTISEIRKQSGKNTDKPVFLWIDVRYSKCWAVTVIPFVTGTVTKWNLAECSVWNAAAAPSACTRTSWWCELARSCSTYPASAVSSAAGRFRKATSSSSEAVSFSVVPTSKKISSSSSRPTTVSVSPLTSHNVHAYSIYYLITFQSPKPRSDLQNTQRFLFIPGAYLLCYLILEQKSPTRIFIFKPCLSQWGVTYYRLSFHYTFTVKWDVHFYFIHFKSKPNRQFYLFLYRIFCFMDHNLFALNF